MVHFARHVEFPHLAAHLQVESVMGRLGSKHQLNPKQNLNQRIKWNIEQKSYSCLLADVATTDNVRVKAKHFTDDTSHSTKFNVLFQVDASILLQIEKKGFRVRFLGYRVKVFKKHEHVGKIAIVTGGGFLPSLMREALDLGCDTYITGIITVNASEYGLNSYPKTKAAVDLLPINVLGASHYLTEKWAPQFSVPYFEQFAPSSFIEDESALQKLE